MTLFRKDDELAEAVKGTSLSVVTLLGYEKPGVTLERLYEVERRLAGLKALLIRRVVADQKRATERLTSKEEDGKLES